MVQCILQCVLLCVKICVARCVAVCCSNLWRALIPRAARACVCARYSVCGSVCCCVLRYGLQGVSQCVAPTCGVHSYLVRRVHVCVRVTVYVAVCAAVYCSVCCSIYCSVFYSVLLHLGSCTHTCVRHVHVCVCIAVRVAVHWCNLWHALIPACGACMCVCALQSML